MTISDALWSAATAAACYVALCACSYARRLRGREPVYCGSIAAWVAGLLVLINVSIAIFLWWRG